MPGKTRIPAVRVLSEAIANKIAAGEVVERPASVVKELVENALDAGATRVTVRLTASGRRLIEVIDNGHGMTEHDAVLAIERHATSKIRTAADLDNIHTLGFRGEALASIAAVSRFELVTRRVEADAATKVRVDGGVLRDVSETAGPPGTRVSVNRLYFNTPVRAKFLKGMTTELSRCIDVVQQHALASNAGFQFYHNDKLLLDVAEGASLRERVAIIWGLNFLDDLIDVRGEHAGLKVRGLAGLPRLTRSQRTHQYFFLNGRPIVNRSLQYGFEDGYRELLTIGRHPVGIIMIEAHPHSVDVNIHPTKREVRFRDERAARDAVRDIVRNCLAELPRAGSATGAPPAYEPPLPQRPAPDPSEERDVVERSAAYAGEQAVPVAGAFEQRDAASSVPEPESPPAPPVQFDLDGTPSDPQPAAPMGMFAELGPLGDAPVQLFDTYLLVPEQDRLLIIDQHALHERLRYDSLVDDLAEANYESQQLAVPLLIDVPASHAKLLEKHHHLFSDLGIEIEAFGGTAFQITAVCHLYDESKIADAVYQILDELAQGDLFNRESFQTDLLRLASRACKSSIKGGDRLTAEERRGLLDGFKRLRPPYTCPHGRPIVTELTQTQMEKSFRRRQ
jgi:DNA mismatch repair protein MutL